MFNCILCKKNIDFDNVQAHVMECNATNVFHSNIQNQINYFSSNSIDTYFRNLFNSVERNQNINNYINSEDTNQSEIINELRYIEDHNSDVLSDEDFAIFLNSTFQDNQNRRRNRHRVGREETKSSSFVSSSNNTLDNLVPKILVKKNDIECAICQQKCEIDSYARILLCGHKYCNSCISQWLEHNKTCPTCRYNIDGS